MFVADTYKCSVIHFSIHWLFKLALVNNSKLHSVDSVHYLILLYSYQTLEPQSDTHY